MNGTEYFVHQNVSKNLQHIYEKKLVSNGSEFWVRFV